MHICYHIDFPIESGIITISPLRMSSSYAILISDQLPDFDGKTIFNITNWKCPHCTVFPGIRTSLNIPEQWISNLILRVLTVVKAS